MLRAFVFIFYKLSVYTSCPFSPLSLAFFFVHVQDSLYIKVIRLFWVL